VGHITAAEWLDLALGVAHLGLAALVLRHLRGFGRAFPWLAALMVFFAVRGSQRVHAAFSDEGEQIFGLAGDALLLLVLVLLLLGLDRTVRALRFSLDEAAARASEYERALADYRRLARHRLANPLAVVRGGVTTLRELELELEPAQRDEILRTIEEAALDLERVALDPQPRGPEERDLRPRPSRPQPLG